MKSLSEIADRLGISRGNASMCLEELRAWGVVQKVSKPPDRQDWYASRGDLFRQSVAIARQRKRREFDPVVGGALAALADLAKGASPAAAPDDGG
jgi:DNA-binding transcriptional regulator GbsR (MarR family)